MQKNKSTILQGPIFPALTKFAVPILFSLILQALYGAVDLWMVGRFASSADVSAVSTGSQTMMIVSGIVTGLSMGITVLLGVSVGEKNDRRSAAIIGTSVWIFAAIGLVLTAALLVTAPALATGLHAPAQAFEKTVRYIQICGAGTVFVVGFNVLNGVFCGLGDSRTPLIFVTIACVTNIVGDYLLIDRFQMGAQGAAIATITAQAVSVICSLLMIRKILPFRMDRQALRPQGKIVFNVLRLGLPVALLRMCNEISYLVILGFVNTLGVTASSGVGIAEKLVMFILLTPTAYMSAISAFVAQNEGAGQKQRAKRSLWVGMATAAVIGGAMAYLSVFHGDSLSMLFIQDAQVIAASAEFLKATAIECFVLSLAYCYDGYFNGIEKTGFVMVQGICAALLIRIPYAYFASRQANPSLFNIGMATALAAVFMLVVCSVYYALYCKREASTAHEQTIRAELDD